MDKLRHLSTITKNHISYVYERQKIKMDINRELKV